MPCHICGEEAVDRCFTCGKLFCARHGHVNCIRCETAIAPGDCRNDHISTSPVRDKQESPWWRPQQAGDFEPPACYACQGLARKTCRNCGQIHCSEHAGPNGLCQECGRSSMVGLIVFLGCLGLMGALILLGFLKNF